MKIRSLYEKMMHHAKISFALFMAFMLGFAYLSNTALSRDITFGKVYYVSVDGNDANPGTLTAPWRTIQKAANTLIAGETVLVREGVYGEFVHIKNSGSAKNGYITYQAYPGEQPIIDGKGLEPSSSLSSLLSIRGASYIVIDGFEIRDLTTSSAKDYITGMKISGGGSHITIINNNIHDISNYASNGNAHGLLVYGDSLTPISDIRISGNEIHHLTSGSSESLTVDGNVKDFIIDYNEVHDNNNIGIDIIGHYNTCSGLCQDQARNGVVANNTVYNIDTVTNPAYGIGHRAAAGIYVDGGTDIIVEGNEVYNSNFGVELASEVYGKTTSNVILRNNFLHHNHGAGIIMGGSGKDNGGASKNMIVNNTLFMNDALQQGYGEITLQNYNNNNVFINNILYTYPGKKFIKTEGETGGGNRIDYNLYYREDGEDSASWRFNGISYKTWDAFKRSTGFDTHSVFADPLFDSSQKGGPYLSNHSPAIDRGSLQYDASSSLDFYKTSRVVGEGIDVGAAEYSNYNIPSKHFPEFGNPSTVPDESGVAEPGITEETDSGLHTSPSSPIQITVDGIGEDWALLPDSSASDSHVRNMKAMLTSNVLYVLITGNLLTEKGQLFINSETDATGFTTPYWSGSVAEYMIENGVLYKYSGSGGANWKWEKVTTYRSTEHYAVNTTVAEYAIPLDDLGGGDGALSIGYVWKDSITNKLPMNNKMQQLSIENNGDSLTGTTPEDARPLIKVDGETGEWQPFGMTLSSDNTIKSVKIKNDAEKLYMLVEGINLNKKLQVYMNADMNDQTGYQISNWATKGIDYLMESGKLYKYSGRGKDWSFKETSHLSKSGNYSSTSTVVELAIPLQQLDLVAGQQIKFGIMLDDNKASKLPVKGDMKKYTIR